MSCPDSDALTLFASFDERHEIDDSELLDNWTLDGLRDHVSSCTNCREYFDDWRASLGRWQDVDLVEHQAFDAAYFEDLAQAVEAKLDGLQATPEPIRLSDRRTSRPTTSAMMSIAAVALLGLAVLWQTGGPSGESSTPLGAEPTAEADLEARGRQLGQKVLAAVIADNGEEYGEPGALWTSADLLAGSADDEYDYFYSTSVHDVLDSLEADEVRSIISRL